MPEYPKDKKTTRENVPLKSQRRQDNRKRRARSRMELADGEGPRRRRPLDDSERAYA